MRKLHKNLMQIFAFFLFSTFLLCLMRRNDASCMVSSSSCKKTFESPVWLERDFKSCTPAKNVAYIKVHKAASSTIQKALFRYGLRNKLHFAVPNTENYFGHGVPFQADMIDKRLIGNFDINIFAIHTQWNYEEVKSIMPEDAAFIASVRDPISLFESLYVYMNLKYESGMTLQQYVKRTPPNAERTHEFGFNQMTFDFGLPLNHLRNATAVQKLIEESDRTLDLVLVSEYLDESLILLRHLLCWTHDDIVTFKSNARREEFRKNLKEETKSTLRDHLSSDYLLYDHFTKKLERLIELFGKDKMEHELIKLNEARKRIEIECSLKTERASKLHKGFNKPHSAKVDGFVGDAEKETCRPFIQSEMGLINRIRKKQEKEVREMFGNVETIKVSPPLGSVRLEVDKIND